jgi:hypothetical protein
MISFKVSNVRDFIEAYQAVFRTTQVIDLKRRDWCCMEAAEGKVYFYRYDGGVYTEAWCDAQIIESGKEVVSQKGFEPLGFCEGSLTVTKKSGKTTKLILAHSRGETEVLEISEDPETYTRSSPTTLFTKFPVDPRSLLWTEGGFLKIGGRYMETNVGTIKCAYYIHNEPIAENVIFMPTDKASLLKEDSLFSYEMTALWIKNGNAIHRINAKSDVFQDEKKSFLAPLFLTLPSTACVTVKTKEFRDAMAYARTITIDPELHYGRCSIRYSGDGVLHVENMWSQRMFQEATYVPLAEGERRGEFDVTVVPGQIVSCLDTLGGETMTIDTVGKALRFTAENGVVGAMAIHGDEWRKLNGQ